MVLNYETKEMERQYSNIPVYAVNKYYRKVQLQVTSIYSFSEILNNAILLYY